LLQTENDIAVLADGAQLYAKKVGDSGKGGEGSTTSEDAGDSVGASRGE
jgi:hypothetical protein